MTRRIDELNAFEEGQAEQASGQSILALEDPDAPKAPILGALAWVHKRRTQPDLKYTEHQKSCRTKDNLAYLFGSDDDPDADAEDADAEDGDASFPEGGSAEADPAPEAVAHAEGAVLPADGDQS